MQRETLFGVSKQSCFITTTIFMLTIETVSLVSFIMWLLITGSSATTFFFRSDGVPLTDEQKKEIINHFKFIVSPLFAVLALKLIYGLLWYKNG